MENFLGRQLWSIYEDLKRGNRIGFLTDDEFQKYFLGFISYKYLSEKLETYINNELKAEGLDFEEAYGLKAFKKSLREKSIEDIGYFLSPSLLYRNIVSSKNYGNIIIEELDKAFTEISDSSVGRESQEDFQNLFEGVDLYASQLGKTIDDKNRVVFNILDALGSVNFDLDKESRNNTLLSKSILENRKFNRNDYSNSRKNEGRLRSRRMNSITADFKDLNSLVDEKMEHNLKSNYALEADMLDHALDEYSLSEDSHHKDESYEKYIDDLIGNSFEYLLSEFSLNSSYSSDYYTPNEVSTLIAKLISSQKSKLESVYDPCCGSASLLLEINKELDCDFICGQELNASFYNIARENMILHNIHYKDFDIKQGDTLEQPQHLDYTFDAVVSQIPFNSRWTADRSFLDDVRFMQYNILPPHSKADYAFIQHMLYQLNNDGIMIVVAPHGVLFRAASEGKIRRMIVKKFNYLDAVIGLPANMFYSTNNPACMMIFKKNRDIYDDVLFIDASKGFDRTKLINYLQEEDISKIVSTYKYREEIEGYSHRASLYDIERNDFNLNIPRYVDTYENEEEVIDSDELVSRHKYVSEEIKKVTKEIEETYKELNISNDLFR
ncbi:MAG: type I restriction-modification system subunit M [Methanobrevibacter ruminantium]|uniref:type I restriction-modification system subunit M n=1 Tax=Methanobrevibacter ruminantium TaxID=83816 RepID=UPI0026EBC674|nr:type I restriction-modification system subunit M [Methanobrevibacter ruminantium]MDO5843156.1 type I restriction-modification system subunit M [Methanobrevibacter ruminantium]